MTNQRHIWTDWQFQQRCVKWSEAIPLQYARRRKVAEYATTRPKKEYYAETVDV